MRVTLMWAAISLLLIFVGCEDGVPWEHSVKQMEWWDVFLQGREGYTGIWESMDLMCIVFAFPTSHETPDAFFEAVEDGAREAHWKPLYARHVRELGLRRGYRSFHERIDRKCPAEVRLVKSYLRPHIVVSGYEVINLMYNPENNEVVFESRQILPAEMGDLEVETQQRWESEGVPWGEEGVLRVEGTIADYLEVTAKAQQKEPGCEDPGSVPAGGERSE